MGAAPPTVALRPLGTTGDRWGRLGTTGDRWGRLGTTGDDWGRLGTQTGDDWGRSGVLGTAGDGRRRPGDDVTVRVKL